MSDGSRYRGAQSRRIGRQAVEVDLYCTGRDRWTSLPNHHVRRDARAKTDQGGYEKGERYDAHAFAMLWLWPYRPAKDAKDIMALVRAAVERGVTNGSKDRREASNAVAKSLLLASALLL